MPKGYNALNDMQVNHLESGICPKHGYWLTSEQCNCYPKETALMFAAEQTKNTDWEQDADRLHELLASDVHPVEEAYQAERQYRCQNCEYGVVGDTFETQNFCECCNGNWQSCDNCRPTEWIPLEEIQKKYEEGTGNDTEDLLASMRQW